MKLRNVFLKFVFSILTLMSFTAFAADSGGRIIIVPLSGFDSTAAATPVGGNFKKTVGEQRLEVFNHAAFLWSTILDLDYDIKVEVQFIPLACSSGSATLGYAGPNRVKRVSNVWYGTAQANQLLKTDTSGSYNDIYADFNSSIDNGCYNGAPNGWYYGLDNNEPSNKEALLDVVLHEIAHGLGFLTFVDGGTGALFNSYIDAYSKNLYDTNRSKNWSAMTNAERLASNTDNALFWDGSNGNAAGTARGMSSGFVNGRVKIHAPSTFNSGSSVSHISTQATPNQLMEPYNTDDGVAPDLEVAMFKDIGYKLKSDLSGNNKPVAHSYSVNVPTNTAVSLNYLANSSEYDGDNVHFLKYTNEPANGTISDMYSGYATYTPNNGFNGTDTVKWVVYDSKMTVSDEGTITFVVGDVNVAPVANGDLYDVASGVPASLNVSVNDTDSDGTVDSSSLAVVSAPSNGSVVVDGTNFRYTSTNGYTGADSFTYTVNDNDGDTSNAATVSLTVHARDVRAVANNDTFSFNSNSTNSLASVVDNDTDTDALTSILSRLALTSLPSNGNVTLVGGIPHYTPNTNFVGLDSFTYKITGEGYAPWDSLDATVNITVVDSNAAPVANNDSVSVNEDTLSYIRPLDNDTDDSAFDPSLITVVSQPSNGSMVRVGNTFNYTPNLNFNGSDSFTYTIADAGGKVSGVATVNITVNPVNDAPVASNDTATVNEDSSVDIFVLANDSDVDGDSLTYANISLTQPSNGVVSVSGNTVEYTPALDFSGSDSFTYTVSDGSATSASATVNVTVNSVIDPAVASNVTVTVNEDEVMTPLSLLSHVTAGDNSVASVQIVTTASNGSASISSNQLNYTPNPNFNGVDTVSYTATDLNGVVSNTAVVTINVTSVNDVPVANNDSVSVNRTSTVVNILTNDNDVETPNNNLTVVINSQPTEGVITVSGSTVSYLVDSDSAATSDSFTYHVTDADGASSNVATVAVSIVAAEPPVSAADTYSVAEDGSVTMAVTDNDSGDQTLSSVSVSVAPSNGSTSISGLNITYTPNANFAGQDTFKYVVNDNLGLASNESVVTVNVSAVNDAPTANNDSVTVAEDGSVNVYVLTNDSDIDGDSLVYTNVNVTQPSNGSVSVHSDRLVYTPVANFDGADSFTYTVSDGVLTSTAATVSVTVTPVADAPSTSNATATVNEDDVMLPLNLMDHVTVNDNAIASMAIEVSAVNGVATISANQLNYTPNADFSGVDTVSFSVTDNSGLKSNVSVVTITVNEVNDAPVATSDTVSVTRSATVIDILSNDNDVEDANSTLTVTIVSQPNSGALSLSGSTVSYLVNSNSLATSDSFTYYVTDSDGVDSNTVNVAVSIVSAQAPVSNLDVYSVNEDSSVTMSVTDNDSGDQVLSSVTVTAQATNGTATASGLNITYVPNANFSGQDTFKYVVVDSLGLSSNESVVTVNVSEVNDAPVAVNDTITVTHATSTDLKVTLNDTDENASSLTVVVVSDPSHGTYTIEGGVIKYTSNGLFNYTTDSLSYKAVDTGGLESNVATVDMNITHTVPTPVAQNDSYSVADSDTTRLNILTNDTFGTNDVTINIVSNVSNGTLYTYSNHVEYESNTTGNDSFTYTITDELNQVSSVATVSISVIDSVMVETNPDFVNVNEDNMIVIDVLSNDNITNFGEIVIEDFANKGDVVINSDNNFEYTPYANEVGVDTFTYTVTDTAGNTSTGTVSITIINDNIDFLTKPDTATVIEDNSVVVDVAFNDVIEGNNYVVLVKNAPSNGNAVVGADGKVTYTPTGNFNGSDSFTYAILNSDTSEESNTSTVTITVSSENDAPVAVEDTFYTKGGEYSELTVLNNDSDVDGDALTVVIVTFPDNGLVAVNGDKIFYEAAYNYEGTDTLTYYVEDGNGAKSETVTVEIHVTEVVKQTNAVNVSGGSNDESSAGGGAFGIFAFILLGLIGLVRRKKA